jgi:DNA repair exonuclease SbcCD ATPase subunit
VEQSVQARFQERIDKLLAEQKNSEELFKENLDILRKKWEEAENARRAQEESFLAFKRLSQEREKELENSLVESSKLAGNLQRISEEKAIEISRWSEKYKESHELVKSLRNEIAEYKSRASKVLQEKEKSIQDLLQKLKNSGSITGNFEEQIEEMAKLRAECEALRESNTKNEIEVEKWKSNFEEIQTKSQHEVETLQNLLRNVEDDVEKWKKKFSSTQIELLNKGNELVALKEQMEAQGAQDALSIKTKDEEILALKKKVSKTRKSFFSSSDLFVVLVFFFFFFS